MAYCKISDGSGVYVLIIESTKDKTIRIGHFGSHYFPKGIYAYIGSALGNHGMNLEVRILRHLSSEKKMRWHIDYLLISENVEIVAVIYSETFSRMECSLSKSMEEIGMKSLVKGFGSSDCHEKCKSHLYYFPNGTVEQLISNIRKIYKKLDLMPNALSIRARATNYLNSTHSKDHQSQFE